MKNKLWSMGLLLVMLAALLICLTGCAGANKPSEKVLKAGIPDNVYVYYVRNKKDTSEFRTMNKQSESLDGDYYTAEYEIILKGKYFDRKVVADFECRYYGKDGWSVDGFKVKSVTSTMLEQAYELERDYVVQCAMKKYSPTDSASIDKTEHGALFGVPVEYDKQNFYISGMLFFEEKPVLYTRDRVKGVTKESNKVWSDLTSESMEIEVLPMNFSWENTSVETTDETGGWLDIGARDLRLLGTWTGETEYTDKITVDFSPQDGGCLLEGSINRAFLGGQVTFSAPVTYDINGVKPGGEVVIKFKWDNDAVLTFTIYEDNGYFELEGNGSKWNGRVRRKY